MLKVAIENSYTTQKTSIDEFGARLFMQELFKKNNIELTRISLNKLNSKTLTFKEYYTLDKNWKSKRISGDYKPDIIRSRRWAWTYYKYSLLEGQYKIISSQKISIISNDKYENYLFLKKHQPKTYLLKTFFCEGKKLWLSEKLVIKPIRASGGNWIELMTGEELMNSRNKFIWLEELFIVQEFKDFSKWYPSMVEWNHDIRLMLAWKDIIEVTLRIPEKWNFKSNIWSWWTQSTLSKKVLPKALLNLSKKIYKELDLQWDDILSMDFAYCSIENKRYLIEINASPGTRYYQTDKKALLGICLWLVKFFKNLKK